MAKSLYSIKGTLFTSTLGNEKSQSELYNEIRSLPGVVTLNTKTLDKEKIALVVKVDPFPYGGKFTEDVHNKIISEIKEIPGVRKFNVYESPFIKAEPKKAFNPIPTSYDNRKRTDSNSGQSISDKS
jgi:hypothetical protein